MSVFRTLYSNLIELPAKAALQGLGTMRALFAAAATTMVVVATSIGALVCRRNREQGGDSRAEPLLKVCCYAF